MKLTVENVRNLFPQLTVEESDDGRGVVISDTVYSDAPMIGDLIRAALQLELRPEQIVDESTYEEGTDWGGMTGRESDRLYLRVLFLYR